MLHKLSILFVLIGISCAFASCLPDEQRTPEERAVRVDKLTQRIMGLIHPTCLGRNDLTLPVREAVDAYEGFPFQFWISTAVTVAVMEPWAMIDEDDCPLLWALEDVLGRVDFDGMKGTNPEFSQILCEGRVSIWEDDTSGDLTKCPCPPVS
jgi:hypothetical protein